MRYRKKLCNDGIVWQQKGLNRGSVETPLLKVLKKKVDKLARMTLRNSGDETDEVSSPLTLTFTQLMYSNKITERNVRLSQVRVENVAQAEASAWEGVQGHVFTQ